MWRNSQLQPQGRVDSGDVRGRRSYAQSQRISTKVRTMSGSPASFHGRRTGVGSSCSEDPLDSHHLTGFRWRSCKEPLGCLRRWSITQSQSSLLKPPWSASCPNALKLVSFLQTRKDLPSVHGNHNSLNWSHLVVPQ